METQTETPTKSKTIVLEANYDGRDISKNEPMTQPHTRESIEKERQQRIESFHTVNGNEKLTTEQNRYIREKFDWKLKMMLPKQVMYSVVAFEEINVGDTMQTGSRPMRTNEDGSTKIVNYFSGFDGVVTAIKPQESNSIDKSSDIRYYYIVI